jgi:hypothetical protein
MINSSIDPFVAEDNKMKLLGNLSEWCSMSFENPIQSFIFMRNLKLDNVIKLQSELSGTAIGL